MPHKIVKHHLKHNLLLSQTIDHAQRDPGVDDATWARLQADKAAAEAAEKHAAEELRKRHIVQQNALKKLRDAQAAAEELAQKVAKDNAAAVAELMRQREEARIRELQAKAAQEKALAAWREKQQEEERRKREEAKVQQKLRQMGVCVAGFQWIKQSGGYRCAGGSHFISDAQLGI